MPRRSKLMVALASTIPANQQATKRQSIATAAGLKAEDVIIVDGATSLALIPEEPDQDTIDRIRLILEANKTRLHRGDYEGVATDIAWTLDHPPS